MEEIDLSVLSILRQTRHQALTKNDGGAQLWDVERVFH